MWQTYADWQAIYKPIFKKLIAAIASNKITWLNNRYAHLQDVLISLDENMKNIFLLANFYGHHNRLTQLYETAFREIYTIQDCQLIRHNQALTAYIEALYKKILNFINARTPTNLLSLPNELLAQVASYLSGGDLSCLRLSSPHLLNNPLLAQSLSSQATLIGKCLYCIPIKIPVMYLRLLSDGRLVSVAGKNDFSLIQFWEHQHRTCLHSKTIKAKVLGLSSNVNNKNGLIIVFAISFKGYVMQKTIQLDIHSYQEIPVPQDRYIFPDDFIRGEYLLKSDKWQIKYKTYENTIRIFEGSRPIRTISLEFGITSVVLLPPLFGVSRLASGDMGGNIRIWRI